jgi:hypothetical protein
MSRNPEGAPVGSYSQAGLTAYLIDPAGAYTPGTSGPTTDPSVTDDGVGASTPTLAAAGVYIPIAGATSAAAELVDPTASYTGDAASAATADPAAKGDGAGASAPTLAAAGAPAPIAEATAAAEIVDPEGLPGAGAPTDPAGGRSAGGATLAARGAYAPPTGTTSAAEIVEPAGAAYSLAGASAPTTDPAGGRAAGGASAPTLAAQGTYIPVTGATPSAADIVDTAGAYSLAGASAATTDLAGGDSAGAGSATLAAPDASSPVTGAASAATAIVAPPGTFLPLGATAPIADPGGTYTNGYGATAPTMDPAGTYSSPYALNRMFIIFTNTTPSTAILPFHSQTAVANYYGATSPEAKLATEFFAAHYADTSATMLFTRFGLGQRPHLLGANLSSLSPTQLQSINGTSISRASRVF